MKLANKANFVLDAEIKSINSEDNSDIITIRGFANTVSKDRSGDVIPASAWKTENALTNYMKNPIILFAHNHSRPIGKCIDVNPTEFGLEISAEILKDSDEAVFSLIKNGILKTFSVGFRCLDADWDEATNIFIIKDLELYEVSVVAVPCNQDSTFRVSKSMNGSDFEEFKKNFINKHKNTDNEELSDIEKLAALLGCLKTEENL